MAKKRRQGARRGDSVWSLDPWRLWWLVGSRGIVGSRCFVMSVGSEWLGVAGEYLWPISRVVDDAYSMA